jgi:hypothetical protein
LLRVKADNLVVYFKIVRQLAESSDVTVGQSKKAPS